MKHTYTRALLALVLVAGIAFSTFALPAQAEGDHGNNNSSGISGSAQFHFSTGEDSQGNSSSSIEDNNHATSGNSEDQQSSEQEHGDKNKQEQDQENERDHASSTESNDHSGNLGNNGIPTSLQGLLDFLQQLKEQVLALLAQLTSHTTSVNISSVTATHITASSTTITWTTDQLASSKVYVSTSTPIDTNTASSTSDSALVLNHSINLTNLSASTTYYYIAESKDSNGHVAQSTQGSFVTQ